MIRALIFDFDGLILETEEPIYRSWKEVYEARGMALPFDLWVTTVGSSNQAFHPQLYLEKRLGAPLPQDVIDRRVARRVELVLAEPLRPGVVDLAKAARAQGTVWAWGVNFFGELGNGTFTTTYPYGIGTPAQVSELSGVTAIAGGGSHSLALKGDGTVWAWGYNAFGQLGNGTNADSNTPVEVSGLSGVTAIAAGAEHSLALKSDGTVWAWGRGQSGNATFTDSNTPVEVSGLSGVTAIAGGEFHSLALKGDGTVWAWGGNGRGQLGNGTNTDSNTPVEVTGLSSVTAVAGGGRLSGISVGDFSSSLALKSDGTVWAWGANFYGELGNGTNTNSNTPVKVSGLSGVTAIDAGVFHSLALKSDGTVWAWGANFFGQLGNGTSTDSNTPVEVSGLIGATAIAGGEFHSLALEGDGTVQAWGANGNGELGIGTPTNVDYDTPVEVISLSGVTAVAGGGGQSLALKGASVNSIIAQVSAANIPSGIKSTLLGDLNAAAASFNRGDLKAGVNQLQQFIQDVSAQSGKKIDTATANTLIAAAQKIISAVTG